MSPSLAPDRFQNNINNNNYYIRFSGAPDFTVIIVGTFH
jgi:hypothetical protein